MARYPPLAEVPRNEAEVDIPRYTFKVKQVTAVVLAGKLRSLLELVLEDPFFDVAGHAHVKRGSIAVAGDVDVAGFHFGVWKRWCLLRTIKLGRSRL
jgi:hypothetical protein